MDDAIAGDAVPRKGKSAKSIAVNLVLTLLAFGLLGVTVYRNRDKLAEVAAQKPNLGVLGLGVVSCVMALFVTFLRWYRLVRALGLPFRFRDAVRLGFIGNVFNLVIPGAVGGDVIKAAFLCREQEQKTQAVASIVIDRAVGLLGLFLLAGLMGVLEWSEAGAMGRRLIAASWILTFAGFVGLAILFTPRLYRPFARFFAGKGRLETLFQELIAMAAAYRDQLGVVGLAIALASVGHALYVLAFFCATVSLFHAQAPGILAHYEVVPLVLLSTAIPLPFGALGVSEGLCEQLFRGLVGFGGGSIAMLGYRAIMYAGGLISAFVYLANIRQVRSLAAQS